MIMKQTALLVVSWLMIRLMINAFMVWFSIILLDTEQVNPNKNYLMTIIHIRAKICIYMT